MDKDMDNDLLLSLMAQDKDFQDFWAAYKPDEIRFPNRKKATFRLWRTRSRAAQKAMLTYVTDNGAPRWKNPYFFVQDFAEPEPTNYNGKAQGGRMLNRGEAAIAVYNGQAGIYTLEDINLYNMQLK